MKNVRKRQLAALAVAACLAGPGALVATSSPAGAAATPPPLKVEAARKVVQVESYNGLATPQLGISVTAGSEPFEIRAYRFDYGQPISAWRIQHGPDTHLPAGSVADFGGLKDFFVVTIKNSAQKVVATTTALFCPNGEEPVRRRPDAPATSPYPTGCDNNPYSLGAVWGIQSGYGVPALQELEVKLTPGTYSATVAIAPKYRTALGISAADATAVVTLKVVKASADDRQSRSSVQQQRQPAPTGLVGRAVKPTGPLPDLRSLPAWGITVDNGRYLTFGATVWNAGPSPLVVDGFRQATNENLMDAYQYFFDAAGRQVGYAKVGTMEWDNRDGHEHWHFTDFATYQLLDSTKKLVLRSQKEAFCLANTDAVDYTVPGANWQPENTDLHTSCGERDSLGVREVLDTGSGDTYQQYLPGQSFDLKGLKNGTYYIFVGANPLKRLNESSTSNNNSYRQVTIGGTTGHRTVKVAKVGIVTEPPVDDDEGARRIPGR